MLGAALQRSGALEQVTDSGPPVTANGIRITSNRNEINNRFPSLGFHVDIGTMTYFEVVLTLDRALFDPRRAGDRRTDNFYSSKQDSGLIQTEDGKGIYLVPPVVLRAFAQNLSGGGQIYYTLIAYNSLFGDNPVLAHPPAQLPQIAPSVNVANDFTGTTLSHVLGMAVERLRTVGQGGRVMAMSLPVTGRASSARPGARSMELIRPFYDPQDPDSALTCQDNAFSIERENWFAGVPNTTIFPHSAICQLLMTGHDGGIYQGTGFYIGRNRILTCAHNLHGKSSVTIIPGRNGAASKPFGETSVTSSSWRIAPGYSGTGDWENDLAVIDNVSLPAPNGDFFNFLHATPSDQMPIVVCGYSAGSRTVPALNEIIDGDMQHLHGGYAQSQSNLEVIEYPILTLMGASGSPVYHLSSASGRLEALIAAVHVTGEPAANGLNRGCFITPSKIDWIEGRASSFGHSLSENVGQAARPNGQTPYPEEGEDAAFGGMQIGSTDGNGVTQPPAQNGMRAPEQGNGQQGMQHHNGNGTQMRQDQPAGNGKQPAPMPVGDDDFQYDDGYGDTDGQVAQKNGGATIAPEPGYDEYGDDDFAQPAHPRNNGAGAMPAKPGPADHDYDDGMDEVQGLSFQSLGRSFEDAQPAAGGGNGGAPLTDDAKRQIIEFIARFESGDARFAAMNLDGEYRGRFGAENPYYQTAHVGLSYGIIQFTQDSGNLGRLLTLMHERDPERFQQVFGPQWNELLQVTNAPGPGSLDVQGGRSARVQPVGGSDLWEEPWVARFREAGNYAPFQAAQNQLAAEIFLDPVIPYSHWLGLNTERGIAVLYDRAVQMGVGGGMRFAVNAVGPIQTDAQRADALRALGHESLEDFQRSVSGVTVDGDWGKQSHAAMMAALRALGPASPIEIPDYEQSLDMLVQAAAGRSWAHRVTSLRSDTNLSDNRLA